MLLVKVAVISILERVSASPLWFTLWCVQTESGQTLVFVAGLRRVLCGEDLTPAATSDSGST